MGISGMNRKASGSEEVVTPQASRSVNWRSGTSNEADLGLELLPVICKGNKEAFIPEPFRVVCHAHPRQQEPEEAN